MNFFTRKYGTYKELIIKCGSATIESGLLDAREIRQIVADMQEAIDELLYEIKSAPDTKEQQ